MMRPLSSDQLFIVKHRSSLIHVNAIRTLPFGLSKTAWLPCFDKRCGRILHECNRRAQFTLAVWKAICIMFFSHGLPITAWPSLLLCWLPKWSCYILHDRDRRLLLTLKAMIANCIMLQGLQMTAWPPPFFWWSAIWSWTFFHDCDRRLQITHITLKPNFYSRYCMGNSMWDLKGTELSCMIFLHVLLLPRHYMTTFLCLMLAKTHTVLRVNDWVILF